MNSKSEICNLKSEIRRRGWTLVEILVVSAVLTLLLAIVASVTHTMFRTQRSTRDDVTSRRILSQLSLRLRDDVHTAQQAEVSPSDGGEQNNRLVLRDLAQRTTQYVFHRNRGEVERVVLDGESPAARDTFPLPHDSSASFELAGGPAPRMVVMRIEQLVVGDPDGGERRLRFEAALGLGGRQNGTEREGGTPE
jgi:prepilin-type N-terminal cleavage/methylation domain-containing protein